MKTASELWEEIGSTGVRPGTLRVWWLYQAGIALKTPAGVIVLVDPYLSDACQRSHGLARTVAPPLDPQEVDASAVLASHSHADHLDVDSIQSFFSHPRTRFIGPPLAVAKIVDAGVAPVRATEVARGDRLQIGDLEIRAVRARHIFDPDPVPDAVGYVLTVGGVSIYHSGDTEYDEAIERETGGMSLSLVPINGTAGNMGVSDAAALVGRQRPRAAIPFHYGLWDDAGYGPGATLDPAEFVTRLREVLPSCQTHVFEPATAVVVTPEGLEVSGV